MHHEGAWELESTPHGVATLWFDRPGRVHNTLGSVTFHEMQARLREVMGDPRIGSLFVRSRKPRGFCAGADLNELAACQAFEQVDAFMRLGATTLEMLSALPIPTTALIHGACVGGGLELALACRERRALEGGGLSDSLIASPEVHRGLVPAWGAVHALPPILGLPGALAMLLGAPPIGADEALRLGLISGISPPDGPHIPPTSRRDQPWTPPDDWEAQVDRARAALDPGDDGTAVARRVTLDVLTVFLKDGQEAGHEAALEAIVELSVSPPTRALLASFLHRPHQA
ncbi:MAG: enoyl-CoA hydratase/isomerase family protein [Isosphaeraceae bacterium]